MRLILVSLFLIIYAIFTIPARFVGVAVRRIAPENGQIYAQNCVVVGFKIILFLSGVKVTVKGKENILHDRAALYIYNHRGFFDILIGYTTAPKRTAFVSKKEIEKVPMISWWMKCMKCLFLDRENIREGMKTILEGIELLKNGTSIYIAPEGSRNKGDGILPFHKGSFKLADKSNCPIVPVAINNTDAVFEKQFPWIKSQHVIIEYCEPIYIEEMDKAERKRVDEKVREILLERTKINAKDL